MRSSYINQQLIRIVDFGDPYYKGVISLQDIAAGTELAWVEKQEFILYELPEYFQFDKLDTKHQVEDEKILFAVYLAYTWLQNSNQFLKEKQYICSINCNFHNLINWTEEELSQLGNRALMAQTVEIRNKIFREFQKVKKVLTQIINQQHEAYEHRLFTDSIAFSKIDEQLFLKMYTIIQSRALYFPSKHDSRSDIGALVPIIEYFNHSKNNQVFVEIRGDRYVARANQDIKKDQQLFVKYGDHGDEEFLKYYGFIEQNLGSQADLDINARQALAKTYRQRRKT